MPALTCEGCGQPFTPDDINATLGLAACRSCKRIYPLRPVAPPPSAPAALPQPAAWALTIEGSTLVLTRQWRGWGTAFPVIFAGFWNLFVGVFWVAILSGNMKVSGGDDLPLPLLMMPHTLVGLGTGYWALCSLLNTTTLRADAAALSVRHAPLPWLGSTSIPRDQVRQLYVSRSSVRVNHQATFNLCVLDAAKVGHTLIGRGRSLQEQRWLEQRIEAHLGIRDEAVPDELPKY